MKPRIKIASAVTPDNSEMILYRHGDDFSIEVNGRDLMHSRRHESELELARLGCANLSAKKKACVLIGGLGMGYTLRETLDLLPPTANIIICELLEAVVNWNHEFFWELNGQPLKDERVHLKTGDIVQFLSRSRDRFDAILLDIDNGPGAITDSGNRRLYGHEGIESCRRALRSRGCLAVWSAEPNKKFEHLLMSKNFEVRRYRVPAHKGSKSPSCFVWLASEDKTILPEGGGEPRPQTNPPSKAKYRHHPRRR